MSDDMKRAFEASGLTPTTAHRTAFNLGFRAGSEGMHQRALRAEKQVDRLVNGMPAAQWRTAREADPFGTTYDCARAALCLGRMTDDELANAVFLHNHRDFDLGAAMSGEPSSIVLLTAAKERIRWLSRALERTRESLLAVQEWDTHGRLPDSIRAVVDRGLRPPKETSNG
ncbi:hypothetical protein [Cupriavidus sp. DL-D2]|uniref:hypothetical protein n=1 Tax=Cupriavidus sp. DL-D2 TaxID=3144974 RepID=UPI0032148648